jgi:hypothetical protein
MATAVYRVYDIAATDINDIEDYTFSIIATDEGAEYVFPEGREVMGLDAERIETNVMRLYGDGEKPETAEDWADVAATNLWGAIYKVEEDFESIDAAKESEAAFATEAEGFRKDRELEAEEPDELLVDDEDEEEEETD